MKIHFATISLLILLLAILLFSFSIYFGRITHVLEENYSLDIVSESVGWWGAGPTIRYSHDSGYRFYAGDEMAIIFQKLYYPIFDDILFNISIYTITLKPYGFDSFPYKDVIKTVGDFMDQSPYWLVFNETRYDGYQVNLYVKYSGSEWKNRVTDFTVQLVHHTKEDKRMSTFLLWSSISFLIASPIPLILHKRKRLGRRNQNMLPAIRD